MAGENNRGGKHKSELFVIAVDHRGQLDDERGDIEKARKKMSGRGTKGQKKKWEKETAGGRPTLAHIPPGKSSQKTKNTAEGEQQKKDSPRLGAPSVLGGTTIVKEKKS